MNCNASLVVPGKGAGGPELVRTRILRGCQLCTPHLTIRVWVCPEGKAGSIPWQTGTEEQARVVREIRYYGLSRASLVWLQIPR